MNCSERQPHYARLNSARFVLVDQSARKPLKETAENLSGSLGMTPKAAIREGRFWPLGPRGILSQPRDLRLKTGDLLGSLFSGVGARVVAVPHLTVLNAPKPSFLQVN